MAYKTFKNLLIRKFVDIDTGGEIRQHGPYSAHYMFPSAHSPVQVCSSTRFDILVKHLSEGLEYKFFSSQVESFLFSSQVERSHWRSDKYSGHVDSDG